MTFNQSNSPLGKRKYSELSGLLTLIWKLFEEIQNNTVDQQSSNWWKVYDFRNLSSGPFTLDPWSQNPCCGYFPSSRTHNWNRIISNGQHPHTDSLTCELKGSLGGKAKGEVLLLEWVGSSLRYKISFRYWATTHVLIHKLLFFEWF